MYQLIVKEGFVSYREGLEMQNRAYEEVLKGEWDGVLFLLEHSPVFTVGTGGGWDNLLCSPEVLEKEQVEIHKADRGGNITFHGPGQIVVYPIFNLTKLKKDAHWYIESLEQVVLNVLAEYGIEGGRKPEYKGVWIDDEKVSAVGVHLKRWVTSHGLSLNIHVDPKYFNQINPCGITEFGVTSLGDHVENICLAEVRHKLIHHFEKVFDIRFRDERK